jgi:hypothetical protein
LGNLTAANGERVLEWELKEPTSLRQLLLAHQEEIPDVIRLWKETECMFTVGVRIAAESTVVKDGDIVKVRLPDRHWRNSLGTAQGLLPGLAGFSPLLRLQ